MRSVQIAIVLLLVTNVAFAEVESPEQQALRVLNHHRSLAGLGEVVLDPTLSEGCREHASYMLQNRDTEAMVGLNAHTQRPGLPGASAAGAACGEAADLFPGVSDLGTAVEGWLAGFYHRRPMLEPGLQRIGVGYARLPDGTLMAALQFAKSAPGTRGWPVRYPASNQVGVPLEYSNEIPNPVPKGAIGGYPITLQFPAFDKVTDVTAKLTDQAGNSVPFFLSDPEHPATSFGQFGVICVIPKGALDAHRTYTIRIDATWKGTPGTWTWSFTTLSRRRIDATNEADILGAVRVPSLVVGTVTHGGLLDRDTVFLSIGGRADGPYKLLSVVMPLAVWKQLAGKARPASFKGKRIEVQAAPQFVQRTYMNLTIKTAAQLRLIASSK